MSKSIFKRVLLLYGSALLAQPAGTFVATGSMIAPRVGYSATLLYNGKVLFAGGSHYLPSSDETLLIQTGELYDPASGSFAPAGNMRSTHSIAVLLSNGKVLLAGGPSPTAEIYDPVAGTFSNTGDVVVHTYGGRAALLPNGTVFLEGYPTAEIYDPGTGTFAPTASYAEAAPAVLQSVTLLADGRVLLTGAVNICYQLLCAEPGTSWAEIYDPATGAFSRAGKMNSWNSVYTATLIMNGKVLFIGGDTYNGIPSTAEVFDPADGSFTAIAPPSSGHSYGSATLMPDGSVLLTGGLIPGGQPQDASDIFDASSGLFSFGGRMVMPRRYSTSTLLPDGSVLIASEDGPAELYRPGRMIAAPKLFTGAIWHGATGQAVSSAAPAIAGEVVSMYVGNIPSGSIIPPRVIIGGSPAEILFFGDAPGYAGVTQVNLRVPQRVTANPEASVRLVYLGRASNETTMALTRPASAADGPSITTVVNAASYFVQPVAEGEMIAIGGSGLGTDHTAVLINGVAAHLVFGSATVVYAVVPSPLPSIGEVVEIVVRRDGLSSDPFRIHLAPASPGVFRQDFLDEVSGAQAFNEDGSLNTVANPAHVGEQLTLLATGLGHSPTETKVEIGERNAPVISIEDREPGVQQLRLRVPEDSPRGSGLSVSVSVNQIHAGSGTTIAVK